MPNKPSDIPESGRSEGERGKGVPEAWIDATEPPPAPTLEQLARIAVEKPTVACHPKLEGPLRELADFWGLELVVSPHVPPGTAYVMRMVFPTPPMIPRVLTPDEQAVMEAAAEILGVGELEESAERRQARFTPLT